MQTWTPEVGEQTEDLLNYLKLDKISTERLVNETKAILSLCGNPKQKYNNETGLVFGYIQSGKTMSFTTLTALARDNGYQLVIVIAGTSTNLLNQSTERLEKDLRLNEVNRKWLIKKIKTKTSVSAYVDSISTILKQWKNPIFPDDEKRTVLITVMKQKDNLKLLVQILERLNKDGVPTLIIDDEGDQASLNTKARQNAMEGLSFLDLTEDHLSTIYKRITELKELLPHHTFLQYTATPQANLFINILDRLSPNFIQLLTPGDAYTGGETFFIENHNLIKPIPSDEIPKKDEILESPPQSLIYAMQIFFLGVASGRVIKQHMTSNRSMMVHPSRLKEDHSVFASWVKAIKHRFEDTIKQNDNEEDKIELLNEFRTAYVDLKKTVKDLPSFSNLLSNKATTDRLEFSISSTFVKELNSKKGNDSFVSWKEHYSWILIGGQAMDRGFTVEGLTVTYMPRSVGVGNVDTIQQRARFFGYKKNYLGYCRIYLDKPTINAYSQYVKHEIDLRYRLSNNKLANKHLDDWERELILDNAYQLARKNIFSHHFDKFEFGNTWSIIKAPHDLTSIIEHNRKITINFINEIKDKFIENEGHDKRTQEQKHNVCTINLKYVFENFLKNLKFTRNSDSTEFISLKNMLIRYLKINKSAQAVIYQIKKGESRKRRLTKKDEIQQLFQGKNPKTGKIIYPGDREIKNYDNLTIQIHRLDLINHHKEILKNVYTIAIWIPLEMQESLIKLGDEI